MARALRRHGGLPDMRRISLAVALVGAVAVAGCGAGAKPSSSGGTKGTAGSTFTVTVRADGAGTVTSVPAGISCPGTCSADFAYGTAVALTTSTLQYFNGWFGDCNGVAACSLSGNAAKYVVASFSASAQAHANFNDPAIHGSAAMVGAAAGGLDCRSCHGASFQGAGVAPSCKSCHNPASLASSGLNVTVTSAIVNADKSITVAFALTDDQGKPVDMKGAYSVNALMSLRLALARIDQAADGQVLPYAVLTPATGSPGTVTMPAVGTLSGVNTLIETGTKAGTYSFTSPATKYDSTKAGQTHTIWIQATRQTNTANANDARRFSVVNKEYNFVPSGTAAPVAKREVASSVGCSKCHAGFKPEGSVASAFHSGARVDAAFCNICHNPGRTSNPSADAMVFVHRIHFSEEILPAHIFDEIEGVTYPQDIRNCAACHAGALQGDQWMTRPTRAACGSCHDTIDFATGTNHNPTGKFGEPANLAQPDDTACAGCHLPAYIASAHLTVAPPDATNCLATNNATSPACNNNTNAGWLPAAGVDVATKLGATAITYDVRSVGLDASGKPTMTFRFLKNGVAAPMDNCDATHELFSNFVGAPSVYFWFAVPQDGIAAPIDFNASTSAYLKAVCQQGKTAFSGTALSATIAGPDASQYYTVTITGAANLGATGANVKMLTGGMGYTYGLVATQPLTQTDLAAPYNATDTALTAGKYNNVSCTAAAPCVVKTGGLVSVAENVWKVATGFSGRRAIVDNAKCKNCHAALGATPTFHAGNRNDGPTCVVCHNANQNNNGWAGNTKDIIHGIHAGTIAGVAFPNGTISPGTGVRSVPFGWHATSTTSGYWDVTLPGRHNNCEACHTPDGYDFSATSAANMLWSTGAASTSAVTANGYSMSPYVIANTVYGAAFSFSATAGTTAPAAGTTLVTSPITAACFGCHDSASAKAHMTSAEGGGKLYATRTSVGGATLVNNENCLTCHGPGTLAPIDVVHK
jgi:OmcA/MtrC family decaheme c-type cytochrome